MDLKICLSGSNLVNCWCPVPVIVWFKHNKHALSLTGKHSFTYRRSCVELLFPKKVSKMIKLCDRSLWCVYWFCCVVSVLDVADEQKRKDLKNWVIYAPCSDLTSVLCNVSVGFGFIKFNQGLKGKQRLGKWASGDVAAVSSKGEALLLNTATPFNWTLAAF